MSHKKPTAIIKLEGNRGKRPLNDQEPEPKAVIPPKPEILEGAAAAQWEKITGQLHSLGLFTEIDEAAITAYCQVYARWEECERLLRGEGMIIKAPSGYPVLNPRMGIINQCLNQIKGYLVEFGMTPSSRSRVKVDKPKGEANTFEDI